MKYSKKNAIIFSVIAIVNLIIQFCDKPLKTSNWISAISFLLLSAWFWFEYSKQKDRKN